MNQDFHYNATYLAAILAGYSAAESQIIAHAAQFVDDCIPPRMPNHPAFPQVPTCDSMDKLTKDAADLYPYTADDVKRARQIWSYFHFLPGNFEFKVPYQGVSEDSSILEGKWTFAGAAQDSFRLMCLPESELSKLMIDDLKKNAPGSPNALHMIGLRMHVLADTWAHTYFSGSPDWCVNDVKQSKGITEHNGGNWHAVNAVESLGDVFFPDNPSLYYYGMIMVPSARYTSPIYLGHGQLGHIPDYGYMRYQYHPVWKVQAKGDAQWQEKDNQLHFLQAFRQMVSAMKAVRTNVEFPQNADSTVLNANVEADIKNALSVRKIDQSGEWNKLIVKYAGSEPPAYNEKQWFDEFASSTVSNASNYYLFQKAAVDHYNLVEKFIEGKLPNLTSKPFVIKGQGNDVGALHDGLLKVSTPLQIFESGQVNNFHSGIIPGVDRIEVRKNHRSALDPYEYVIVVHGGCPKWKVDNHMTFTDRSGDTYNLRIVSSTTKEHTVKFNSVYPDLTKVTWDI